MSSVLRKISTLGQTRGPPPIVKMAEEVTSKFAQAAHEASDAITDALEAQAALRRRGEELTVIQHEGWLYKRGAGYHAPAHGVTPNKHLTDLLHGSAEKRRYFMLVTTRANQAKKAGVKTGGPMAEIRYYEKGRPESSKVKPKGSIVLTAEMSCHLEDNGLALITPTRVFYLRPDVALDQAASAKARTSASQWSNAIQFALSGLRAWELAGGANAELTPHPMGDRRSIRAVDALPQQPRKARHKSGPANAGNPLFSGATALKEDVDFCELWAMHGIEAYDAVVAHFGPVQTDMTRMRDHLASRLAQVTAELAVLDGSDSLAKDTVVKEQRSIALVQKELHKTAKSNALALRELKHELETGLVPELDAQIQALQAQLDAVVQVYANARQYVDAAKKAVAEFTDKIDRLVERQADAKLPPEQLSAIETEVNEARQARRDATQQLLVTEAKSAESISKAMKRLEEIETGRLAAQIGLLKRAGEAEAKLLGRLALDSNDSSALVTALDQIDPARDLRASFQVLKLVAEKARPMGKHRKKNSLMGRLDFKALSLNEVA